MNAISIKKILRYFLVIFAITGCGVNADQRNFEQEALSPPDEITETDAAGRPVEGEQADASDWRIAPEFRGLISVETPAYPNPVSFNSTVSINLSISGIQAINGLQVFVYRPLTNTLGGPFFTEMRVLNPGLTVVTLSPQNFVIQGTGSNNLYRIVVYDGSQNIITYGDVKVI